MNTFNLKNTLRTFYCIVIMLITNNGILLEQIRTHKNNITLFVNFLIKSKPIESIGLDYYFIYTNNFKYEK